MHIVGLTGGIATGKSLVAGYLTEMGLPVVDADDLAREVVQPGRPALAAIGRRFGAAMLAQDGSLDRAALGAVVFSDLEARRWLEAALHPLIEAALRERAGGLAAHGHRWLIYDAALLVETGAYERLAAVLVVSCSPAQQLARLMARDGLDEAAAQARIDAQMPLADKLRYATETIDNSGTPEATRAATHAAWTQLERRLDAGREPGCA